MRKSAMTHGGRREGAGRKPSGHVPSTVRLTPEQTETLKKLGGSAFLRSLLDGIKAGRIAIPVDTTRFTGEKKIRQCRDEIEAIRAEDDGN